MPASTTYSDGEVATTSYTAQGWPTSLVTTLSGVRTNVLTALAYTGVGGAAGHPTAASVANGTYTASASYDADLRLSSLQLTDAGVTKFAQSRGYDNIGDVTSATTTLPAGIDAQTFCYDEFNRLTWAASQTATGPCGAQNTAGTLSGGAYTSTYTYDTRNRLTGVGGSGAASYSFGSGLPGTAPLDGVTANGTTSHTYDAAGDRTNAGTTTGDVYDAERRLVSWNVTGGSGKEAYDGAGRRVAHQTTSGVTTTTTYDVGSLEEVDAASGAVTTYYATPAGTPAALRVGTGAVTYLATDGLGSVSAALDGSGNVAAAQLFGPYGQGRYVTGTLPTTKGYTGQRADAASGLDYYGARYYDPATDQFVSVDTAAAGLNRYAYVAGNPETATDPTGHRMCLEGEPGCGGGSGGGGGSSGGGGTGAGSGGGSGGGGTGGGGGSGSGSGGSGGSGGTGNGTGQGGCGGTRECMAPPSAHGGGSKCVGACAARKAASDAAGVFNWLRIFFGVLAAGGMIAAAYFAAQAAEDALAGEEAGPLDAVALAENLLATGNAAAFMAAATVLAVEFDALDTAFTDESQHDDSWWTDANINQFNLTKVFPIMAGANTAGAAMIQLGSKLPIAGQWLVVGGVTVLGVTVAATVLSSDAISQEYIAIDPPPVGPLVGPH
jgi:RHS repeat-associated protein